ncbi:MAG TPA: hypothetical protein VH724_05705 [Candidatus Angelobacter sp.]|jgi:hypothetical protein|nr:hypothetical protein [Candidatus Angelobacter sp.]
MPDFEYAEELGAKQWASVSPLISTDFQQISEKQCGKGLLAREIAPKVADFCALHWFRCDGSFRHGKFRSMAFCDSKILQ